MQVESEYVNCDLQKTVEIIASLFYFDMDDTEQANLVSIFKMVFRVWIFHFQWTTRSPPVTKSERRA